ncbi:MAG TPA: DEAD/DEAH box helicase [Candidatus Paenibacillus intestinavium]|nr:DEAD/DEAH box helicase [Candidatus Paenibacillus intestinavium]
MHNDNHSKAEQMLQLFQSDHIRAPQRLTLFPVQLRCIIMEQSDQYMMFLEIFAGLKKKFHIAGPKAFLEAIVNRLYFPISKTAYYDPDQHYIAPAMRQLAVALLQMLEFERASTRMKSIPLPAAWYHRIAGQLLAYEHVTVEYYLPAGPLDEQLQRFDTIEIAEGKLPLPLTITEDNKQYWLRCSTLHHLIVMPAYELAIMYGQWFNISYEHAKQLQGIQKLLLADEHYEMTIEPHLLSSLLDVVLPKLHRIAHVVIADEITTKVIQQPLQAQLFLDRVRDRLLVGLEFHYGGLIINPLLPEAAQVQSEFIMLREREKEQAILNIIAQIPSLQTEGGWIIESDEDEYSFLHDALPKLKLCTTVLATTAVRVRYVAEDVYPELTLSWDEKSNWLQYSFSMTGISNDELREVIQSLKLKRRFYRLSQGTLLSLEHEKYDQLIKVMNELGLEHPTLFDDQIPIRRSIGYIQSLPSDSPIKLSRSLKKFIDHIQHPELYEVPIPQTLTATLRDYQIDGYQWMRMLADYNLGGLLADEMGLGKTIQVIAFLTSVLDDIRQSEQKVLIVTPASLLYNWQAEFQRFAPTVRTCVVEASDIKTSITASNDQQQADVWIVSYQALRQHIAKFMTLRYHTLVCDEAQAFKNDYTLTAKAVKAIDASYRFALTGTPIENRLDELWSIMNLVNPNTFTEKQHFMDWPRDVLLARISPFLLRRKKSEVIEELPDKIETTLVAPLLPQQKKIYLAFLAKLQEDTLKHLDPKQRGKTRIKLLAGITRLRQICCHPSLFMENYDGGSAKLEQLLELVADSYREGKRLLIFSQFTSMLHIISQQLALRGYQFFYIDGQTPPLERVQNCDRFNNGERDMFLLSLKAGGTGLNLTGADTVVLYDLWWNPAVEQQAADRVHRIGQRNVVNIIKLVAEGTLEDKMLQLQQRKQQLIDDILEADETKESMWDPEQVLELLAPSHDFTLDEADV